MTNVYAIFALQVQCKQEQMEEECGIVDGVKFSTEISPNKRIARAINGVKKEMDGVMTSQTRAIFMQAAQENDMTFNKQD